MKNTKLVLYYFLPVLVAALATFSEGRHDYSGNSDGHLNRTLKEIGALKKATIRTCGSFFKKEEFITNSQKCLAQQPKFADKPTLSSSSESEEDASTAANNKDVKRRERRFLPFHHTSFKSVRLERDVLHIGKSYLANQRGHGHWKMFENMHVFRNPCLIPCVLEKLQMINSSGHVDSRTIQSRAEQVFKLANVTNTESASRASNVTNVCVEELENEKKTLWSTHNSSLLNQDFSSDGVARAECRLTIQLSKCIVHNVFEICKEHLYDSTYKNLQTTPPEPINE